MGTEVAASIDWVAKGAVTPVKNQQSCGSCWAFSTTGSIEGAYFVATNKLVSLSEEDLVQCDDNGDQGCQGGLMDNAFQWVESNGIAAEGAYPYTSGGGTTGTCNTQKKSQPVVTITGYNDVPAKDEDALKAAVSKQPVSVAIEADKNAFQFYSGGVLDNSACGTNLDHGVLLVGYGTEGGKDYWKVKNSWGASPIPGPSPTPGPAPSPTPGPAPGPSPGCADQEDATYCNYVLSQSWCDLLAPQCQKTCGCCGANPPDYCNGSARAVIV